MLSKLTIYQLKLLFNLMLFDSIIVEINYLEELKMNSDLCEFLRWKNPDALNRVMMYIPKTETKPGDSLRRTIHQSYRCFFIFHPMTGIR